MIIEYIEGGDLASYLRCKGPILEEEATGYILQILHALRYLHHHPNGTIIHRDLKPGNLLIQNGILKLSDLGLAIQLRQGVTEVAMSEYGVGTRSYLPPESQQAPHNGTIPLLSEKYDIWAVGVCFFLMLFGKKPFQEETQINTLVIPDEPLISSNAKEFIVSCLSICQKKRFSTNQAIDHLINNRNSKQNGDSDDNISD